MCIRSSSNVARAVGVTLLLSGCSVWAVEPWTDHPVNTWVKQSPREGLPVPDLKYEGSGALDPKRRQWIHFAGHDGIPQGFYLFTYAMKEGVWKQRFPNTSPPGVCCVDGANTFDLAADRFVAFPGGSLGHGYQWSRGVKLKESNVWLYDPDRNAWTNMRPPPYKQPEKYSKDIIGRLDSASTYDANHEVSIAFGGQGSGGSTNALWVYDAYANHLERLRPPESPPERDGMGLCYDTRNDCLVMFGSQYSDDERTWIYRYETNRWEGLQVDPHPPGRKEGTYSTNPKLAFDSANGVCLCIVRRGEKSGLPSGTLETWALDVGKLRWTKLEPAVSPDPGASRARNLSYWPQENLFVLESVAAEKHGMQIWTYRFGVAPSDRRPGAPVDLMASTEPGKIALTWRGELAGGRFHVYRALAENPWLARFEKIATVDDSKHTDQPPPAGMTAFYRVAAVDRQGVESPLSSIARNQPRVMSAPVVSVLEPQRVEIEWEAHKAADVVGYNLYRGVVSVGTVLKGEPSAWKDNDPEYAEPKVVAVKDISELKRLNDSPLKATSFVDALVNLSQPAEASGDYKYAVYAYLVRAVNQLGAESGPSPYALTIPAEPQHVLLREDNGVAEIQWSPSREISVKGYHLYKLGKSHWHIERVTAEPVTETRFRHEAGKATTRYWVVPVDRLDQEGQPSSPVWYNHDYRGFFDGPWHQ